MPSYGAVPTCSSMGIARTSCATARRLPPYSGLVLPCMRTAGFEHPLLTSS